MPGETGPVLDARAPFKVRGVKDSDSYVLDPRDIRMVTFWTPTPAEHGGDRRISHDRRPPPGLSIRDSYHQVSSPATTYNADSRHECHNAEPGGHVSVAGRTLLFVAVPTYYSASQGMLLTSSLQSRRGGSAQSERGD